ncbi:MAG: hypothetical protein ABIP80_03275 [Ferruginibacter sp.]
MKKIFIPFLVTLIVLNGCTDKNDRDPKVVVEKFIDALSKKDMATVRSLSTIESKFVIDQIERSMNNGEPGLMNFQLDKSKLTIGEANVTGDEAKVSVSDNKSGEAFDISLKKQLGEWKVSFEMNAMMGMVMKKMKQKGINISDSLRALIPRVNINFDSIRKKLKGKGLSMDSVRAEMKRRGIRFDSSKGKSIEINF